MSVAFGGANGLTHYVCSSQVRVLFPTLRDAVLDWIPFLPLAYAGACATALAMDSARQRRVAELQQEQLRSELAASQLQALRAQIHPHFLFNTLNAAVALSRSGGSEGTANVLAMLSELPRYPLRSDAPQEVPLSEEIGLLETYQAMQRVRWGDRLSVQWEVDAAVRNSRVPQLLLQPLVENALRHGLGGRARGGTVRIGAAAKDDRLEPFVEDDGTGLEAGFSVEAAQGVGLRNTVARLSHLYGEEAPLQLVAGLHGGRYRCGPNPPRAPQTTCADGPYPLLEMFRSPARHVPLNGCFVIPTGRHRQNRRHPQKGYPTLRPRAALGRALCRTLSSVKSSVLTKSRPFSSH